MTARRIAYLSSVYPRATDSFARLPCATREVADLNDDSLLRMAREGVRRVRSQYDARREAAKLAPLFAGWAP